MKQKSINSQKETQLSVDEFKVTLKAFQQINSEAIPVILHNAEPKSMKEIDDFIRYRVIDIPAYSNSKTTAFSFYKSISMCIHDKHK